MQESNRMNVAIVHHHLNRGGVTRVIFNHLSSLQILARQGRDISVAILYGGRAFFGNDDLKRFDSLNLELIPVPQLEYDNLRTDFSCDEELDRLIEGELFKLSFEPTNSIVHVHNHSLGKNAALPPAIKSLAARGYRFLLQIHDFAEDFRDTNYQALNQALHQQGGELADVYPDATQIAYAAINGRDHRILNHLGLRNSKVHFVPNAVSASQEIPNHQAAKAEFTKAHRIDPNVALLIYPVRGIRRKNIGEAILLTAIAKTPICMGLTLAPLNETERPHYDRWKRFVEDHHLPVLFELGENKYVAGLSFETNIAAADRIVTTSVAEGFGLVFLESFALGKQLLGRDLPLITEDFKKQGVEFAQLYTEIRVPLSLVNMADFRQQFTSAIESTWNRFGCTSESLSMEEYFSSIEDRGRIDFGRLPSALQRAVIGAVLRDPRSMEKFRDENLQLIHWLASCESSETNLIDSNREIVQTGYSLNQSATQLSDLYRQLLSETVSAVETVEDPRIVLHQFLDVEEFFPVRIEDVGNEESCDNEIVMVRECLNELQPLPTGVSPKIGTLSGIRAVLFDIYGTLLVSASGDVGTDPEFEDQQSKIDQRLDQLLAEFDLDLLTAAEQLASAIGREHHELKSAGIPYPEIEIRQLWQSILGDQQKSIPASVAREIAFRFELLKNPVWKMPGFDECLASLKRNGFPLGIVSNAQFYTPLTLESLSGKSLEQLGFLRELSHFSFRIGRAKPDQFLYKLAAESLAKLNIETQQVLYVGNDMTKDILPSKALGFVTGLFAGDQRSLRCGDHGDPYHHHSVDHIFTDLIQISNLLQPK